ncbi:hypothetical protein [Paenibacillus sedimenti]|uniref:Uncharacterized protein n=1 Tax=Paenibacillus sedimenti TaxID=2770274 RepID=A0A926KVX1_9BACL|nr:hypothetical protein [Paenibacillus sedimenti]MBD0382925.1 hypothetical protein [Paenibacillus sedimenti]
MKILVAYFVLFLSTLVFLVFMDILSGMKLWEAIEILKESLSVTSKAENAIILVALFVPFYSPLTAWIKRRKRRSQSPG